MGITLRVLPVIAIIVGMSVFGVLQIKSGSAETAATVSTTIDVRNEGPRDESIGIALAAAIRESVDVDDRRGDAYPIAVEHGLLNTRFVGRSVSVDDRRGDAYQIAAEYGLMNTRRAEVVTGLEATMVDDGWGDAYRIAVEYGELNSLLAGRSTRVDDGWGDAYRIAVEHGLQNTLPSKAVASFGGFHASSGSVSKELSVSVDDGRGDAYQIAVEHGLQNTPLSEPSVSVDGGWGDAYQIAVEYGLLNTLPADAVTSFGDSSESK